MSWARMSEWRELSSRWIAARPVASNPEGLARVREELCERLSELGFEVEVHASDRAEERGIVVAQRRGSGSRWLGISSHYDVEDARGSWSSDPWTLSPSGGRLYGRGIADNLGPLAQRLVSSRDLSGERGANLVWVIEGEEELGSPWAQRLYPRLALPPVDLWLEETGYFYKDGAQRVLARGATEVLAPILGELGALARADGRELHVRERFLNKAFGVERCPTLQHLVGASPYLAIGPNDDWTRIHAPDESIDPSLLELCDRQFRALVEVLA